MKVTDKALQKLKDYQPNSGDVLLVSILGGGCSGLSYHMEWQTNKYIYDKKLVEDEKTGLIIATNLRSALFLDDAELDFTDGLNGKGFEWNNPMAARTCGCGNSFSV